MGFFHRIFLGIIEFNGFLGAWLWHLGCACTIPPTASMAGQPDNVLIETLAVESTTSISFLNVKTRRPKTWWFPPPSPKLEIQQARWGEWEGANAPLKTCRKRFENGFFKKKRAHGQMPTSLANSNTPKQERLPTSQTKRNAHRKDCTGHWLTGLCVPIPTLGCCWL